MINPRSEDLAYAVVDELGPDIASVRFKEGTTDGRLFFTGIELAIYVGTLALIKFTKAFIEKYASTLGEALGDEAAKTTVSLLKELYNKIRGVDLKDEKSVADKTRFYQTELDKIIDDRLSKLISSKAMYEAIEAAYEDELMDVKSSLMDMGFSDELATTVAERIVKRLQVEWKS